MSGWIIAALVLLGFALGLLLVPLRVKLNMQGKGEPDGFWALAGGAQLGPIAGSGVGAHGVEPMLQLHVFGRKVWQRTLAELLSRKAEAEKEPLRAKLERAYGRVERGYRRVERRLDPIDLGLFVLKERRRLRIEKLVIELEYSFSDITRTGKLLGAIHALSAVLPPEVEVLQSPSWDDIDRGSFAGSGSIKLWPGLLLVDAGWFLIRNVRVRRRPDDAKPAGEAP